VLKGALISTADQHVLRSTVDREYQTPPTFLPLTVGGGGGPSWWFSPSGPLITCHLPVNSDPPHSLPLTAPPPPPPSKPPNHSSIPPPHSDVTLHYHATLHVTLHITLHSPVSRHIPSTRWPLITLHVTSIHPLAIQFPPHHI
jgi:hypothetical protein